MQKIMFFSMYVTTDTQTHKFINIEKKEFLECCECFFGAKGVSLKLVDLTDILNSKSNGQK